MCKNVISFQFVFLLKGNFGALYKHYRKINFPKLFRLESNA